MDKGTGWMFTGGGEMKMCMKCWRAGTEAKVEMPDNFTVMDRFSVLSGMNPSGKYVCGFCRKRSNGYVDYGDCPSGTLFVVEV